MRKIHTRMPVVLGTESMQSWMTDEAAARALLKREPPQLVKRAV